MMFKKVLIANRGAIACRIIRTLKQMGIRSVAVYSKADAQSLHVSQADEAICIGEALPADTYLNQALLIDIAHQCEAQAIHPGYGFLSENQEFADRCEQNNIVFIGPRPKHMRLFGLKHTARSIARENNIPLLMGTDLLEDIDQAIIAATQITYPVMLKSTAGGGGIGMQICHDESDLRNVYQSVKRLSENNFGNSGIFLEKYIEHARHIEVQVFGDGRGHVVTLGERDCSLQRRNQKVVEETPAPMITDQVREAMQETARTLCAAVQYQSAGTVEFIYDPDQQSFYFLEVNTRLQVEHGVTEEVTGVDLVEWMIRHASGESDFLYAYQHQPVGHSIQVRLYAEDPGKDFQPSCDLITEFTVPDNVRCETWVETGIAISPYYDPMLAKLIVRADQRSEAIQTLSQVLANVRCAGVESNLQYLQQIIEDDVFKTAQHYTRYLNRFQYHATTVDVLEAGTMTTVQDYPGRTGYWDVGVPPSGPVDALAFRLGNRLLNNPEGAAGLELTLSGPTLKFNTAAVIVLTGAAMQARLDGQVLPMWKPVEVSAGAVLVCGRIIDTGVHSYLCIQGGILVPDYLGSKSTFTLGRFGGHCGRALRPGDVLHISSSDVSEFERLPAMDQALIPAYAHAWEIRTIYGPHGAPDFFTESDIETFFNTEWEIHYNSSRTGIRLIGPKPQWARQDGGEAGLHPSNIHDNAYAIGTVDFTGDMPVILGPDGPSLGGFVCPATIIKADLWKMGQLHPGDRVRFVPISLEDAKQLELRQERMIDSLTTEADLAVPAVQITTPVLKTLEAHINGDDLSSVKVVYRPSGDDNLLIEYGPMVLDLNLRFRVHALMEWIRENQLPGIIDLTPGIRSLQVHVDDRVMPLRRLIDLLEQAETELPAITDMEVPSRIVHLPLSWDDESTQLAIVKYMQGVRKDAPWCPSNIEFIRRINGLQDIEDVKNIVFNARYMVLGLGDVYLGAPVATPLDPRHRLVTTKYNPARTWTPENAVGIGGAYLCVYGMEGPGGYQFVGRTLQMWNRYKQTREFVDGKPWLLRFFDQIRFYPVDHDELMDIREEFPRGTFALKIEDEVFKLREYNAFLQQNSSSINVFKDHQQQAFEAERERWIASGQAHYEANNEVPEMESNELVLEEDEIVISSPVAGSVWKVLVEEDMLVSVDAGLIVVESMKMEMQVKAVQSGTVTRVLCNEGQQVTSGQSLLVVKLMEVQGNET